MVGDVEVGKDGEVVGPPEVEREVGRLGPCDDLDGLANGRDGDELSVVPRALGEAGVEVGPAGKGHALHEAHVPDGLEHVQEPAVAVLVDDPQHAQGQVTPAQDRQDREKLRADGCTGPPGREGQTRPGTHR